MTDAVLVDALALPVYDFGDAHPFAPFRQRPLFDLLRTMQLVSDDELIRTASANDDELRTVHERDYVEIQKRLDDPGDRDAIRRAPLYGMGTADNPIQPGQHAAAAAAAGATLACVRDVLAGHARAGFNPTGGLHHAMPGSASGFCLYNDLAIGIKDALAQGVARVAYVDFDVHHGDGVEWIFREDPRVLTISFHETPRTRWPFTGRAEDRGTGRGAGSAINVPFEPGTCDPSWQSLVDAVLEPAITRFAPELLVTQHGCDPHVSDPLADLSLGTASFEHAARLARRLADQVCAGRWVATGGGGYQPVTVIPRAWSMVWCALSGRATPDAVDPAWRARWQEHADAPIPERFCDEAPRDPREPDAARCNAQTLASLRRIHPHLLGDG